MAASGEKMVAGRWGAWVAGLAWVLLGARAAIAGPPFQTDDPDPVAFRHFEMYAFSLSDGTTEGGTTVEVPSYEVNYGVVPNVQLHLVFPLTVSIAPQGGPVNYGAGDTELGAKIRFVKEAKYLPEVGIFPFFELPSGSASKGLGVGTTWYRLPLWIQKSWGSWTSYGGGGEAIVPGVGYKDYPFAGLLVQRQINKRWMLGMELYGHGAEGEAATSTGASTMADLGGSFEFKDGFDLLFAGGRSIYGQPETYTYLALYWTWGPGGSDDKDAAGSAGGSKMALLSKLHLR
jgi:hypothetical protein